MPGTKEKWWQETGEGVLVDTHRNPLGISMGDDDDDDDFLSQFMFDP